MVSLSAAVVLALAVLVLARRPSSGVRTESDVTARPSPPSTVASEVGGPSGA